MNKKPHEYVGAVIVEGSSHLIGKIIRGVIIHHHEYVADGFSSDEIGWWILADTTDNYYKPGYFSKYDDRYCMLGHFAKLQVEEWSHAGVKLIYPLGCPLREKFIMERANGNA